MTIIRRDRQVATTHRALGPMNSEISAEDLQVGAIKRELNEIRRGRGIDAPDLFRRIGPNLRAKIGVHADDTPNQIREKLILAISRICDNLPADLRLAALTAFSMHEESADEFLDRRISWLAGALDRDPRTARRRIDSALDRVAETLSRSSTPDHESDPFDGCYIESLKVLVRVDNGPLTVMEERKIVAIREGLSEVTVQFSARDVDLSDQGLEILDVLFGGEVVARKNITRSYRSYTIRLPRPLSLGQSHEYGALFTLPPGTRIRPHYLFSPLQRVEHLDLRVKFNRERLPGAVWLIDGMPAAAVEDLDPLDHPVALDRIGEARQRFDSMQPGFTYGLCWSDTASASDRG